MNVINFKFRQRRGERKTTKTHAETLKRTVRRTVQTTRGHNDMIPRYQNDVKSSCRLGAPQSFRVDRIYGLTESGVSNKKIVRTSRFFFIFFFSHESAVNVYRVFFKNDVVHVLPRHRQVSIRFGRRSSENATRETRLDGVSWSRRHDDDVTSAERIPLGWCTTTAATDSSFFGRARETVKYRIKIKNVSGHEKKKKKSIAVDPA